MKSIIGEIIYAAASVWAHVEDESTRRGVVLLVGALVLEGFHDSDRELLAELMIRGAM